MSSRFTCPCCGYRTLLAGPGAYDLCPICFWEDDGLHEDAAASREGPNGMTLAEGQRRFLRYGSVDFMSRDKVRAPGPEEPRDPDWQPVAESDAHSVKYFVADFSDLLESQLVDARETARRSRSDLDVGRFEGIRAAFELWVRHGDDFWIPRDERGLEREVDLFGLDPPEGHIAG